MMLRHSFNLQDEAKAIEDAVSAVLSSDIRTADISTAGIDSVGTVAMGDAISSAINSSSEH